MGVNVNRMLNRTITVTAAGTSTLIGVGREGVLDGGDKFTVTIDGTGATLGLGATKGDLVVSLSTRTVRGGQTVTNTTTYPVVKATKVDIDVTGLCAYEILFTCTTNALVDEDWAVNCVTQRGA